MGRGLSLNGVLSFKCMWCSALSIKPKSRSCKEKTDFHLSRSCCMSSTLSTGNWSFKCKKFLRKSASDSLTAGQNASLPSLVSNKSTSSVLYKSHIRAFAGTVTSSERWFTNSTGNLLFAWNNAINTWCDNNPLWQPTSPIQTHSQLLTDGLDAGLTMKNDTTMCWNSKWDSNPHIDKNSMYII